MYGEYFAVIHFQKADMTRFPRKIMKKTEERRNDNEFDIRSKLADCGTDLLGVR